MEAFVVENRKANQIEIVVIANWAQGHELSGGDRIFIELSRQWSRRAETSVALCLSEEGAAMCRRSGLTDVTVRIWSRRAGGWLSQTALFVTRTLRSMWEGWRFIPSSGRTTVVYSASDFWPDALPGLLVKWRHPGVRWIAGFYLFAPNPFRGYQGQTGFSLPSVRGAVYFLTQRLLYPLILRYADLIFVTSQPDRETFVRAGRRPEEVVVVQGGVDAAPARDYLASGKAEPKTYDACFVGRFHAQKGVLKLVDIWEVVRKTKPDARLAVIGMGELEKELRRRIDSKGLSGNVDMLGFLDGWPKYEIFKRSRLILHPATYDSGGMAACEGMAWGLPGVSFDLEALKTYYPKGMLKAPPGDTQSFASLILNLLQDRQLYEVTSREARSLAGEWDWQRRAELIFEVIKPLCDSEACR